VVLLPVLILAQLRRWVPEMSLWLADGRHRVAVWHPRASRSAAAAAEALGCATAFAVAVVQVTFAATPAMMVHCLFVPLRRAVVAAEAVVLLSESSTWAFVAQGTVAVVLAALLILLQVLIVVAFVVAVVVIVVVMVPTGLLEP